ncbi:hypothetical protein Gbth_084_002 [Gluconobacter thailandicus F149-1 = NBRC 100600]|nr:hypothetical protein Gbfr_042_072 [Gluconobacter frateurii M-2]GAN94716.1 hypothetical protein Gbth_084_002 [Gluconobacter thailandicus F149-1 = NBRC 100600]GBR60116.1 hypothetical protein AA100600_1736 [Gluconobacter thailandicus F149-1 = NBRC 100600]GEL88248.1 hypothetical protein GTH01_26060 [Gluconobacter thailandicus F149-1 = NBRC 100600]
MRGTRLIAVNSAVPIAKAPSASAKKMRDVREAVVVVGAEFVENTAVVMRSLERRRFSGRGKDSAITRQKARSNATSLRLGIV